jgi:hypothetical protein
MSRKIFNCKVYLSRREVAKKGTQIEATPKRSGGVVKRVVRKLTGGLLI